MARAHLLRLDARSDLLAYSPALWIALSTPLHTSYGTHDCGAADDAGVEVIKQYPGAVTAERRASKVVNLHKSAVNVLLTSGEYIVSGGSDGFIKFFDFDFRVIAWFEDLDAGPVASVSFATPMANKGKLTSENAVLTCPDFCLGTSNALIVACTPSMQPYT